MRPRVRAGGGLAAVRYVLAKAREAGGVLPLWRRLRSRNACKTCALGMGGQQGGMVNEVGRFPEVCKKSVQAQAGDMAAPIAEDFFRTTPLGALARMTSAELERLGRLGFPVMAGPDDTHFRRIGWPEALDRAGAALRAASPAATFFYASGRSSNEAAFLLQLVARAYGTQNVHNCSFYCHSASSVALGHVHGSGTASVALDDLALADLVLVAGANPASNHPRLVSQLVQLRRRGGGVIVVNPLRELGLVRFRVPSDWRSLVFGSTVSDVYLQPHVGGDVALFKALLKAVVDLDGVDREFVAAHTSGWDAVAADLAASSWETLVTASGVARADIERTAAALVGARRGIFCWAMGLTHHAHGVDNVQALANLALARGWLGRPGCGLLPIRGHSNVQGVGTCGVTPALKAAFAGRLEALYGIPAGTAAGDDTYASMLAAAEGRVEAAVLLGGNLFASNPDRTWAAAALRRVGTSIALATKLNEGHVHGRGRTALVLPVLARDEEPQPTTQESMFNFVRLSDGGLPAVAGEMRSEVDVIASLAELILPPGRFEWAALRSHRALREAIARVVPGMEPMAQVDETRREFAIGGRVLHEPRFATPDGRARFAVTPLPAFAPAADELRLMTVRSEGQFNTVVYEEEDLYRGTRRRDVVLLAAADAARLGVAEGERVRVATAAGALDVVAAIADIRPGSIAMYYPEANALVPQRLDPRSRTPAFKSVAARVARVAAAVLVLLAVARPSGAHDVPVSPSTCALDPVEIGDLAAAPPGPADTFRIVWDVGASRAQLDLRAVPPRALAGGGTVTLPPIFEIAAHAEGDLVAGTLPIAVDAPGMPPSLAVALTTGLADGGALEGEPLGADGRFVLVGRDPASGHVVRIGCRATPPPDLDQFRPSPLVSRVRGTLSAACPPGDPGCRTTGSLRILVATPSGVGLAAGRPVTVRVSAGGDAVAVAHFPAGLQPDGKTLVADAEGAHLVVRERRGKAAPRWSVVVSGLAAGPALAAPGGDGRLTFELGGLLGRAPAAVSAASTRNGVRVRVR
jgi:molybdopterin-dependent oxidoreductase alpha subunit